LLVGSPLLRFIRLLNAIPLQIYRTTTTTSNVTITVYQPLQGAML